MQRDDPMRTQGENGHPHSRDRVLNQPCQSLDLGPQATRTGREKSLWFQQPHLCFFVMEAPAKWDGALKEEVSVRETGLLASLSGTRNRNSCRYFGSELVSQERKWNPTQCWVSWRYKEGRHTLWQSHVTQSGCTCFPLYCGEGIRFHPTYPQTPKF